MRLVKRREIQDLIVKLYCNQIFVYLTILNPKVAKATGFVELCVEGTRNCRITIILQP